MSQQHNQRCERALVVRTWIAWKCFVRQRRQQHALVCPRAHALDAHTSRVSITPSFIVLQERHAEAQADAHRNTSVARQVVRALVQHTQARRRQRLAEGLAAGFRYRRLVEGNARWLHVWVPPGSATQGSLLTFRRGQLLSCGGRSLQGLGPGASNSCTRRTSGSLAPCCTRR